MSKSGQPATKADTGGQRVPKTRADSAAGKKKAPKKASPATKGPGKTVRP